MRNIFIDTHSVGRSSLDKPDNLSIKVHFKRNLNTNTSKYRDPKEGRPEAKSKDEAKELQSLLERRSASRKRKTD